MFSAPKSKMSHRLALAVFAGVTAGCLKTPEQPAAVARHPIVIDAAMEHRPWPIAAAHYQNGASDAWPTGFILTHSPDEPQWAPAVTDTPIFLANVIAMPLGYAFTPGWTRVIYAQDVVPPTYHAMPPLPGDK